MISNSGSNENGKVYGGQPGDQTGREWQIRTWYNRPWKCVLHHPDAKVRALIAEYAEQAAKNNLIGYNQLNRNSFWAALKKAGTPAKINVACDADCSAGVCGIVKAVGYTLGIDKLKAVSEKLVTSQMRAALKKAGFSVYTASKYLTSDKYLARGDILLNDAHHTAINLANGTTSKTTTAPAASKNPYSEPNYTVMRGSTGSGVKWVQWELTRIKYSVGSSGIDGIYGKDTFAAVLKFQKKWFSSSKEWDGIVGPKTRAALKSA